MQKLLLVEDDPALQFTIQTALRFLVSETGT